EAPRAGNSHRRVLIVALVLVGWMFVIGARLVQLQVSQHETFTARARNQQLSSIQTSATRGPVVDRQGRELARSVETASFFADPREVLNANETAKKIAAITGQDRDELAKRLGTAIDAGKQFVWIARRVEIEAAKKLDELELKGIYSRKEPKRYYPNDSLAAHVLGFVGMEENGLGGVEQYYNEKIRGEAGKVFLERDGSSERRIFDSYEVRPNPGQTVVLTIDQTIQYRTEQALSAAVERAHAKSGTAIVMDPRTGEILALANAPSFNPNQSQESPAEARVNGALQTIYEPGSTFKIVAYSAAIEKGLVKPEDKIDCQMGQITVAGRLIHDHKPFGLLTIADALAQSSNVGAIKLGLLVGNDSMYEYMKRLGFGSRTGIDLTGESPGILRSLNRWQPASIGSLAIGQEIGVTPLQMATAYSVLANDGMLVKPHLVRELRSPDGAVMFQAKIETRRALKAETTAALRNMLEGVTLHGTARKAQLEGYTAAGKTGTAQKIDPKTHAYSATKYIGSFVGFAPVNNPAVVIIVVIDEPQGAYHGGDVAAPVFREIAEQILPDLSVSPDIEVKSPAALIAQTSRPSPQQLEEEQQQTEARAATLPKVARSFSGQTNEVVFAMATKRAALMPDLRGQSVRDVLRMCQQLGLRLEARGEGHALRQSPAAGSEVDPGLVVRVDFGRGN
ncbi:MAG TPA: penicillin-binding protein, partial [Pyrinomonadaceae bacterium]|nr:penicillin-binding protein [Pyrinomonadaceae bacterium]